MSATSPRELVRGAWRGCILVTLLLGCIAHFLLARPKGLRARSRIRQLWCGRVLKALGIDLQVHGPVPTDGVIVGNHLSYLDIMTYGAVLEAVFISKLEVRSWPLIGLITRFAHTIYIDRNRRRTLLRVIKEARTAMDDGMPVMYFPEGTTTDASAVLPFYTAIFEAPVRQSAPIWSSGIAYTMQGSSEHIGEKVCFWGDMEFMPHLIQFLRLRDIRAVINFAEEPIFAPDRRTAAKLSHAEVVDLVHAAETAHDPISASAVAGCPIHAQLHRMNGRARNPLRKLRVP